MKLYNVRFIALLSMVFILQQHVAPAYASGQHWLRPMMSHNETGSAIGSNPAFKASSGGDSVRAQELVLNGTAAGPNQTVIGRASLLSVSSTTKILRGIRAEDSASEYRKLNIIYENILADINQITASDNTPESNQTYRAALREKLKVYYEKAKAYYQTQHTEEVISEAEAMLDFLIEHDKELARRTEASEQEQAVIADLQQALEQYLRYKQPLVANVSEDAQSRTPVQQQLVEERAREEWARAQKAGDELKGIYARLEAEQQAVQAQIKDKIDALSRRIEVIQNMPAYGDNDEQEAREARIQQHRATIAELGKALKQAQSQEGIYMVAGIMIDDSIKRAVRGAEYLAAHNTTATACIYNQHIRPLERILARLDKHKTMYTKMAEGLRTAQDLVGHLNNIEQVRMEAMAGTDPIVLCTDHDIGVPSLLKLLLSHNIKGVVTTAGSIGSHWVVVAAGKGIPVIILRDQDTAGRELADMVALGDDMLLEMNTGEQASRVVIRPGQAARMAHELVSRRNELEHRFFLQENLKAAVRSQGMPISVYGNIAEEDEVGNVVVEGGEGIGLFRTEIALDRHNTILKAYVESVAAGSSPAQQTAYRDTFFYEYTGDMLLLFENSADITGPIAIRTFDIELDKAQEILAALPANQQKTGFDLYKTPIGRDIVVMQLAAIINAYYIYRSQEARNISPRKNDLKPVIVFPMIKTADDTILATRELMQEAVTEARAKIGLEAVTSTRDNIHMAQISFDHAIGRLHFGIMGETLECVDNIDEILQNPSINKISIGTNDLTKAGLSQIFNISVSRDDVHFGKFFFELIPSTLTNIEALVRAVSQWNQQHPDNEKTVTICGAIASRKEGLLFAAYLQQKYNVNVAVSAPANMIPTLKYFRSHIVESDIQFLNEPFGFVTEKKAVSAVQKIEERIIKSPAYQAEVTSALAATISLFDSIPKGVSIILDTERAIEQQVGAAA